MLTRLARSLADSPADADDVVQETFARLWEQRDRLDPDQSVRAYLVRAVRNRALNGLRDARTRQTLLHDHASDVAHGSEPPRPDEVVQGTTLADRLRAGLARLPDRQRTALALTRVDGLSHAEAADAMGCSARTVNNHIVRGLQGLRTHLQAYAPDAS